MGALRRFFYHRGHRGHREEEEEDFHAKAQGALHPQRGEDIARMLGF